MNRDELADHLVREIEAAWSRRWEAAYGPFIADWTRRTPRSPAERLAALVTIASAFAQDFDPALRIALDYAADGSDLPVGLVFDHGRDVAVYGLRLTAKLVTLTAPDGRGLPSIALGRGGAEITRLLATLAARHSDAAPRPPRDFELREVSPQAVRPRMRRHRAKGGTAPTSLAELRDGEFPEDDGWQNSHV